MLLTLWWSDRIGGGMGFGLMIGIWTRIGIALFISMLFGIWARLWTTILDYDRY